LKPFIRRVATGEEESRDRTTPETDEETGVASTGREILGEHYDDEHLTYEEIRGLGLGVVTEKGETVPTDELQGKIRHPPGGAAGRRPGGARGGRPRLRALLPGRPLSLPPPGGTGLGLAIVKATVDAHGGDVTLRTAAGQGTAVRVELPILEGGDQFAGPVPSKQWDRA
jgi:hypothetical protein